MSTKQTSLTELVRSKEDIKTAFKVHDHVENFKGNIGFYETTKGEMVLQIFPLDNIKNNGLTVQVFLDMARKQGLKVVSVSTNPLTYIEEHFKAELFPK